MNFILISVVTAFVLIRLGFLSLKKPTLISGYNKWDDNKKKRAPVVVKNILLGTGLIIVLGGIVSCILKNNIVFVITYLLPLFCMLLYTVSKVGNLSEKPTKIVFYSILIFLILILVFLFFSSRESVVTVNDSQIIISGLYRENIPLKEIKTISLLNTIPAIELKTNGYALGEVRKGYFRVNGLGKVKLFFHSNQPPYIHIQTKANKRILINLKDPDTTTELYNRLITKTTIPNHPE